MSNQKLILITAIFFSSFAQAHSLKVSELPSKLQENNFASLGNGQQVCDSVASDHPNVKTCFPILNLSQKNALILTFPNGSDDIVQSDSSYAAFNITDNNSFDTTITLFDGREKTNVIYTGPIKSWEGLICDDTECHPWPK
ncbi:hypothetical protein [Parashewanella tropica]|uniref:hypothetical protein n=1 Tax=Parashewanella tropica TaxID=2547970 RepID=UPI00105A2B8A|nr:hypothetical protein [Parashewanella tropica]